VPLSLLSRTKEMPQKAHTACKPTASVDSYRSTAKHPKTTNTA